MLLTSFVVCEGTIAQSRWPCNKQTDIADRYCRWEVGFDIFTIVRLLLPKQRNVIGCTQRSSISHAGSHFAPSHFESNCWLMGWGQRIAYVQDLVE